MTSETNVDIMQIRQISVHDIEREQNFPELLVEYAEESSIAGMPPPSAKMEIYRNLEASGALYVIAAFFDGVLIGFITILAPDLPHYSAIVAVSESFFVAKKYRKTGAGLKLLRRAEDYAKAIGSPGLLVSAPFGGKLFEVLPGAGYKETNRIFFKELSHE